MANPVPPNAPLQDARAIYEIYRAHNSGLRIHTDTTIQTALLAQYPSHTLTSTKCDLIEYANAGHAVATLVDEDALHPTLHSWAFEPAARRSLDGSALPGTLAQVILFGRYDYVWHDQSFQVFVVDEQNNNIPERRWYVLHHHHHHQPNEEAAAEVEGLDRPRPERSDEMSKALVLEASIWAQSLHDEIWVYDQGRWIKDKELWRMVQGASWDDLILEEDKKRAIFRDVMGFFDARETYRALGTPWKVRFAFPFSFLKSAMIYLD